jgi:hypothetical protein
VITEPLLGREQHLSLTLRDLFKRRLPPLHFGVSSVGFGLHLPNFPDIVFLKNPTTQRRALVNRSNSTASLAHTIVRHILVLATAHRASEPFLLALVIDFHSPVARDAQALSFTDGT